MRYLSWTILTSPIMHWESCWSPNEKASTHPSCSIKIKTGIQVYFSLHGISIVQKRSAYTNVGDEGDEYAGYDGSRLDFQAALQFFWFSLWCPSSDTPQNVGYDITMYLKHPNRKFGEKKKKKKVELVRLQKKKLWDWTSYTIFSSYGRKSLHKIAREGYSVSSQLEPSRQ